MAKLNDQTVPAAFAPHLQPGEQLKFYGFGVKQPNVGLIILFMLLGVLPGVIITTIMTKNYLIGLTDRRLIVLQVKSMGNHQVTEVLDWALSSLNPAMVVTSTGPIFTHIRIDDPQKPFVAKFHRAGMKTNREHCQAIAAAISQKQLAA
jgi:hypothetical protein